VKRAGCALVAILALLALSAPAAGAAEGQLVSVSAGANGAKRMLYRVGPFQVVPGQNEIGNRIIDQKPAVDGWITRIRPDLTYTNGRVPGVDVIHLHHGVWLNLSRGDATWPGLPSASSRPARRRRSCGSRRGTATSTAPRTRGSSTT
jgi:hypothetical protein